MLAAASSGVVGGGEGRTLLGRGEGEGWLVTAILLLVFGLCAIFRSIYVSILR